MSLLPFPNFKGGTYDRYFYNDSDFDIYSDRSGVLNKLKIHNYKGYFRVYLRCKKKIIAIFIHRLVFYHFNKHLPKILDHADGNKLNNNISNLRPATAFQNSCNINAFRNKNGFKGCHKKGNRYRSYIYVNKKPIYLGSYEFKEDAALAYNIAALELFGEFASLNKLNSSW